MANLLRMDLYRMFKARSFRVCLALAFALALLQTPMVWGLSFFAGLFSSEGMAFPKTAPLPNMIADPFPMLNAMLCCSIRIIWLWLV